MWRLASFYEAEVMANSGDLLITEKNLRSFSRKKLTSFGQRANFGGPIGHVKLAEKVDNCIKPCDSHVLRG